MALPSPQPSSPQPSSPWPFDARDIAIHDGFLGPEDQHAILTFLSGPGWGFGAYSDSTPGASRYWYKHFAGIVRDGAEKSDPVVFESQLDANAPLVAKVWRKLQGGVLSGHTLSRCYANGYPPGSEGGVHMDSNISSHFTSIYYPQVSWHPNFAGETVFFNSDGSDIIASVYPKPNRLVVFPGVIPHVARGVTRACNQLRITLMFKTSRETPPGASPPSV
jgi:SM-20-related protein